MSLQQKRAAFQQVTEFEWRRIIGLREEGFFYRAIVAYVQRNISRVKQVSKQCRKCESRLRTVASTWFVKLDIR